MGKSFTCNPDVQTGIHNIINRIEFTIDIAFVNDFDF